MDPAGSADAIGQGAKEKAAAADSVRHPMLNVAWQCATPCLCVHVWLGIFGGATNQVQLGWDMQGLVQCLVGCGHGSVGSV